MTAATADVVEPLGYAEYGQRVRSAIVDSLLIGFAVGAPAVRPALFGC